MMNKKKVTRSPLAIVILGMLSEEPMHPYRMQQLIKERAKDEVVNVRQRASVYQTIDRLLRDGLIAVRETGREGGRPDRTVYEATPEGRGLLLEWLRDIIAAPTQEFPEFPVALAFLPHLTAADAQLQMRRRVTACELELERIDAGLREVEGIVPRLFLIEMEYKRLLLAAELDWVRSVVADMEAGRLTWNKEWLLKMAQQFKQWQEKHNH